jgi:exonuclease III
MATTISKTIETLLVACNKGGSYPRIKATNSTAVILIVIIVISMANPTNAVKISTTNVGSNIETRWKNTNTMLEQEGVEIACFQETRISKSQERDLQWKCKTHQLYGLHKTREQSIAIWPIKKTAKLRKKYSVAGEEMESIPMDTSAAWNHLGIITLIKKEWATKVIDVIEDPECRYLTIPIRVNETQILVVINVYTPVKKDENEPFFYSLSQHIGQITLKYACPALRIIVAGDMNAFMKIELDKKIVRGDDTTEHTAFKDMIRQHHLLDCFRDLKGNEIKREFTRSPTNLGELPTDAQQTRIDHILYMGPWKK